MGAEEGWLVKDRYLKDVNVKASKTKHIEMQLELITRRRKKAEDLSEHRGQRCRRAWEHLKIG